MNKQAAIEWLRIAYHDLKSAQILFNADHYTDSIGCDLQQAIEKTLKATIAYENRKIPKSHDLFHLYTLCNDTFVTLEKEEITYLHLATEYYKEDRYPNPNYFLPEKDEIKEVLRFAETFLLRICNALSIAFNEIVD